MRRENYDNKEEDNDGRVGYNSWPPPPRFGMTTTMTTMIRTMTQTLRAHVSSACTHATDAAHKQFWFCNPTTVEGSDCFATSTIRTREGGEFNTTMTTTTTMTMTMTTTTTKLHKVKKHILCQIFFNSPRATEAVQRHTNPWNIDMIFMD
jgi:hypothetical protein